MTEQPAREQKGPAVPPQKRRVLACHGGPCHNVSRSAVWSHLQAEQERLALRTTGARIMSAKAAGLGPCNLASVVQVWPNGIYYIGVDEAGVDRVIGGRLLGGGVVEDLVYRPAGGKQALRS